MHDRLFRHADIIRYYSKRSADCTLLGKLVRCCKDNALSDLITMLLSGVLHKYKDIEPI